jgi:hypothetical protein
LRKWLRDAENLNDTEEIAYICGPEIGRNISDEEETRSIEDIIDCKESISEILGCQVGNGMILVDLVDFHVGRKEIPDFQVGKGEEINSKVSSDQQGMLTEEDQRSIWSLGELKYSFQTAKQRLEKMLQV